MFPRPAELAEATFTEIERVADPLALRAVTSTEVWPGPTGVRVTTLVFTSGRHDPGVTGAGLHRNARGGEGMRQVHLHRWRRPADRETGANVPTARGAAAATVTRIVRVVDPPAFRAP